MIHTPTLLPLPCNIVQVRLLPNPNPNHNPDHSPSPNPDHLALPPDQVGLLLPLSVTGFVWGVLYVGSGNLLVPILIHALWNTRVFLGSYLGL